MNGLILMVCEFLTVILPFVTILVIYNKKSKGKEIIYSKKYFKLVFIFAIYIFVTFYLTGAGTLADLRMNGIDIYPNNINLEPFSRQIDKVAYVQNILLFVPLGFLLPLIWSRKFIYTLFSGFSFSLLIELSQLLNNRKTDIDDLIMNTIGTLLGYVIFKIFAIIFKKNNEKADNHKYEAILYIFVMFIGRFLLFNEMGLAKILYRF